MQGQVLIFACENCLNRSLCHAGSGLDLCTQAISHLGVRRLRVARWQGHARRGEITTGHCHLSRLPDAAVGGVIAPYFSLQALSGTILINRAIYMARFLMNHAKMV